MIRSQLSIGQVGKWLLEFITRRIGKLMMRQNERLLNRQYFNWRTLLRRLGFFIPHTRFEEARILVGAGAQREACSNR
jgi:hypothetical protein